MAKKSIQRIVRAALSKLRPISTGRRNRCRKKTETKTMGYKYKYLDAPSVPVRADLPHLRDGGEWKATNGIPKRRIERYLGQLKALGMRVDDAQCMMSDLYWDCYLELSLMGPLAPVDAEEAHQRLLRLKMAREDLVSVKRERDALWEERKALRVELERLKGATATATTSG